MVRESFEILMYLVIQIRLLFDNFYLQRLCRINQRGKWYEHIYYLSAFIDKKKRLKTFPCPGSLPVETVDID